MTDVSVMIHDNLFYLSFLINRCRQINTNKPAFFYYQALQVQIVKHPIRLLQY